MTPVKKPSKKKMSAAERAAIIAALRGQQAPQALPPGQAVQQPPMPPGGC